MVLMCVRSDGGLQSLCLRSRPRFISDPAGLHHVRQAIFSQAPTWHEAFQKYTEGVLAIISRNRVVTEALLHQATDALVHLHGRLGYSRSDHQRPSTAL